MILTGFDTASDASSGVVWTVMEGGSNIVGITYGTPNLGDVDDPMYASTATITLAPYPAPGVVRIRAERITAPTPLTSDYYVDFTILIDATTASDADNVTVDIFNIDETFFGSGTITVKSVSDVNNALFANSTYSFLNFPTAANVFDQLVLDTTNTNVVSAATDWQVSYVNSVTMINNDNTQTPYINQNLGDGAAIGWQYGVIRNGDLVPESRTMPASAFILEDYDYVMWVYGYKSDVDDFFDSL